MFRGDLFKRKRFLVTGGGTGLGRIMMERFVELGADCVICGRRGSVLEETARAVMAKHPGRRVDTFAVDIRVATAVEEMIGAQPMDAVVLVGGCDKSLPALVMGATRATELAHAGLLTGDVIAAERAFATPIAPWCPEIF